MIHHLLKVSTGALTAIVGINDAPLVVDASGAGLAGARPANPWLKPMGNKLTVFLDNAPAPRSRGPAPTTQPAAQVRAQVYTLIPDSPTNQPDRLLATFERNAGDPGPLPVTREIPFEIAAPPPTKLWADAAAVATLSDADKQKLRTLVQKHAEAIERRDLDSLSAMLEYKTTDCALANGQEPDHMAMVTRQQYIREMFSESSFKVEGAQGNELEFKLIAGGQVVWMYQNLDKPALVVVSPNKRFTLPIYAALIAGTWRIVR
jgi:hypothetical protein